jgi:tetratricopeptide (TPR) repeat protein
MKLFVRIFALAVVLFAGVTFLTIGVPSAQAPPEPEKPKNLKVLPKSMTRREVIGVMRGFSHSLGVRCTECHVSKVAGSDRPEDMDYAADKKPSKETARKMLKMVAAINEQIDNMDLKNAPRVGCMTCHHGVKRPESLADIMNHYIEKDSLDTAIQTYRDLRTEYYGSAAYDFTSETLIDVARGLAETKKDFPNAIKLLQVNLEYWPNDADVYATLGSVQMASGDKAAAMTSLEKALQIDPNNRWAKMQMDRAKSGQ